MCSVNKCYVSNNIYYCSARNILRVGKQSKRFRTTVIVYWRALRGSSARCHWCYAIWVVRVLHDRPAMPTHRLIKVARSPHRIVAVYLACQHHHRHQHWTVYQHLHHRRHWIEPLPLQRQPQLLQLHLMSHKMTIIIIVITTIWVRIRIRLLFTGKRKKIIFAALLFNAQPTQTHSQ